MLNLEIKVRVDNLAEIAEILSAFFVEELFQTDTYFKTKKGVSIVDTENCLSWRLLSSLPVPCNVPSQICR